MKKIEAVKRHLFYSLVGASIICIMFLFAGGISINVYGDTPELLGVFKAGLIGCAVTIPLTTICCVYFTCCSKPSSEVPALPQVEAKEKAETSIFMPSQVYESIEPLSNVIPGLFSSQFSLVALSRSRSPVFPQLVVEATKDREAESIKKEDTLSVPMPAFPMYPLSRSRSPASTKKESDCLVLKEETPEKVKQKAS